MLEGFIERVRGNDGSGIGVDGDENIAQMVATDAAYERAEL